VTPEVRDVMALIKSPAPLTTGVSCFQLVFQR